MSFARQVLHSLRNRTSPPQWRVDFEGVERSVREQVARDLEALRDVYLERTDLDPHTVETLLNDAAKVTRQGYGQANVWEAEAWG